MHPVRFALVEEGPLRALAWEAPPNHDSSWAIAVPSDGRVYVSSCSEGAAAGAHLLRYDPARGELVDLLDIGELSGDRWDSGRVPQSKIHTCLRETSDGWLYGVSHCTAPAAGETLFEVNGTLGDPVYGYRGAQMFRVRLATGEAECMGCAIPFEGCRTLEIDEHSGMAWLVSYPRHCLWSFELATRTSRNRGRIGTWGGFDIFLDRRGRVYGSYDDGRFFRYLPSEERFEDLPVRVPGIAARRSPYNFFFNVKKFRSDFVCANGYYDGHLFRYDPEAGEFGALEDLGSGWPEEWDGRSWTPPYVQAPVLCRGRWLFYGCNPIWQPTSLMRLDLETGRRESLGTMRVGGVSSAWLAEGAISADQSTLYFADVNMKAVPRMIMVDVDRLPGAGERREAGR